MAFEGLSEKNYKETFRNLRGKGVVFIGHRCGDARVSLALSSADVNFKVVKQFVATIKA